jgi:Polyketide cyclase / dehydrase and lipid transport
MGGPVHAEASVEIDRSPAEVWDAIANYSFDLRWRDGLLEMTPDPPGPAAMGTKVHEVVKNSGREYVADTVVTEFDPGSSYRFEGEGTIGGIGGGRSVRPAAGGSGAEFTYEVDLRPTGGMRLLRPVLGTMVRSGLKKDLQALKGLLETDL